MNPFAFNVTRSTFTSNSGRVDSSRRARLAAFAKVVRRLQFVLTLLAVLGLSVGLRGAGTVTNASLGSLNTALVGGGTVVCAFDGTMTLTNTLTIAQDTTLDGTGHNAILSGNNQVRLFQVKTNVTLTLIHLTMTRGLAAGPSTNGPTGPPSRGGAIENDGGVLNTDRCTFSTNTARGGDSELPGGTGGDGLGGDIFNRSGVLNLSNTTFLASQAIGGNAILANTRGWAGGGSIFDDSGTVTLVNCTFSGCNVNGGALLLPPLSRPGRPLGAAFGGAVYSRGNSLTGSNCVFLANSANPDNPNLGLGFAVLPSSAGAVAGGAVYIESGMVNLSASSFVSNQVQGGMGVVGSDGIGGAIFNHGDLRLTRCVLASNRCLGGSGAYYATNLAGPAPAGSGGAVCSLGSLTAVDTLFLNNTAIGGGNGIAPDFDGTNSALSGPGKGGAIYTSNTVVLVGCSFASNQAVGGEGRFGRVLSFRGGLGAGGAIYTEQGVVLLTNVTFESNVGQGGVGLPNLGYPPEIVDVLPATGGDGSAGAFFCDGPNFTGINLTIANNQAEGGDGSWDQRTNQNVSAGNAFGGAIYNTNGTVTLQNTIVANNSINSTNSSPGNAYGLIIDGGNNLSSDASCNFTNSTSFNNTDPVLGPLDNYGGPTLTMPLLAGSPAIDHGNDAAAPATDQRGRPRPFGAHSDIGAFESSPPYTIRGRASSFWVVTNASIIAGSVTTNLGVDGQFDLEGLTPGNYMITPSLTNYLFMPTARAVTVGPDVLGLDFKAYRFNGLTPEPMTNVPNHLVFAGSAGQTWEVDASTNLMNWQPVATNTVATDGVFNVTDTNGVNKPFRFYRARKQ